MPGLTGVGLGTGGVGVGLGVTAPPFDQVVTDAPPAQEASNNGKNGKKNKYKPLHLHHLQFV
ncbi:hypothetical protein [Polynucleobacter rarus]|uniref:hypothetical protein n=1 Tax=Polynucleobacter rarus TaxID=556055 RepID=UPI00131F22DB|nr:hypothetical protein [Polynucleobacter rarus]